MMQQTLILIKPDGLKKSLTGNVLTRLSETKLDIVAAKIVQVSRELAEATHQSDRAGQRDCTIAARRKESRQGSPWRC